MAEDLYACVVDRARKRAQSQRDTEEKRVKGKARKDEELLKIQPEVALQDLVGGIVRQELEEQGVTANMEEPKEGEIAENAVKFVQSVSKNGSSPGVAQGRNNHSNVQNSLEGLPGKGKGKGNGNGKGKSKGKGKGKEKGKAKGKGGKTNQSIGSKDPGGSRAKVAADKNPQPKTTTPAWARNQWGQGAWAQGGQKDGKGWWSARK